MERFSRRESILLGYNLQNQRSCTNPSTPNRNSDIDFHDVFGGPPRRSSIQEIRYSMRESQDLSIVEREDEEAAPSCAWPRVSEKPVFGEENANWRRYPSNDFFDDIFGGEESQSSTPRRHERDPFSASRVLSPARPLPPKAEPFGTSSLPAAFSLPAKMTKGTELPTFDFPTSTNTRTLNNNIKDGTSNGLSSWDSPATSLSRFSSQAGQGKDGFKNGQSLLSQDKADKEINLVEHSSSCEVAAPIKGQFHFSIYKWASKGVPLLMPLRTDRNSRTKEKIKMERCSSAKESMVSENTIQNDSLLRSSLMKSRKQEDGSTYISTKNGASTQETAPAKPQSETLGSLHSVVKDVPSNVMSHKPSHSLSEIGLSGKTKEEPIYPNPIHKPRSLHTLFNEVDDKQDFDKMATSHRKKENKAKNLFEWNDHIAANPKIREETTVAVSGVEVDSKVTSQGSSNFDENLGNGRVKGKVKEFVRIFNQEPSTKSGIDNKSRIQGSEYKHRGVLRTKNEVEDCSEQSKKENSGIGIASKSGNNWHVQDEIPASAVPDSSDVAVGDKDETLHENFLVKELDQGDNEVLQSQNNEEIQVIDAKIRQWSNGKEGNIRSLLSTLQYVLWPESGWKPVPLVDIIEGNAVKRTYQRALLCLHPDKLQQKGATLHQKYIAEKVYDILQEAWTHFNILGAI